MFPNLMTLFGLHFIHLLSSFNTADYSLLEYSLLVYVTFSPSASWVIPSQSLQQTPPLTPEFLGILDYFHSLSKYFHSLSYNLYSDNSKNVDLFCPNNSSDLQTYVTNYILDTFLHLSERCPKVDKAK